MEPSASHGTSSRWRTARFALALALLNLVVTFRNVWPTPGVTWRGDLSVELAVVLLLLALATRESAVSVAVVRSLSAVWVALSIGRYAQVAAPALYGREINWYWDIRYVPDVFGMLVRAAPWWLGLLAATAGAVALTAAYLVARWAFGVVASGLTLPRTRGGVAAASALVLTLFAAQQLGALSPAVPSFAVPVAQSYLHQLRLFAGALIGSRPIPASPPIDGDLTLAAGADVFLLFLESYGAVSFDRPEMRRSLAPARAALDATIRTTHREVASAFVESPTFGGSSWLAHLSLLSGIEVRDPDTYALLLTQRRSTLVTAFQRRGYRAFAIMPGLYQRWPEGSFYGFDDLYDFTRLDYRGPKFGWFEVPDQFSIARVDQLEVSREQRAPLFVVFPTISTHTPFAPTPPYQRDWSRLLTPDPYALPDIERAFNEVPDWTDLGTPYVAAVKYAYECLDGYLRLRADRDLILIVLGDHQPPAAVTGEGASWDVPVHVVSSRRAVIDRFVQQGFRLGLEPLRPHLARMHELLPILTAGLSSEN